MTNDAFNTLDDIFFENHGNKEYWPPETVKQYEIIRAALAQPSGDAVKWHIDGNFLYTLKHHSWKNGEEKFQNATTIKIDGDNADQITKFIHAALAPVDVEGLVDSVVDSLTSLKKEEFEIIGAGASLIRYTIKHLAARGCFGVPEGYALVPIEKQFDGKTFRLIAAEYGCLQDISLTVRDMGVLEAAPKKEGV